MKYLRLAAIGAILGIGVSVLIRVYNSTFLTCNAVYRHDTNIKIGSNSLSTEVEKSPKQLTTGLSGKACIDANQAILFDFTQPGYYKFWMKDMRFPIDIVWINTAKQVVYVKPNVTPESYPQTFASDQPAQYVLELKAGRADQLDILVGTQLTF